MVVIKTKVNSNLLRIAATHGDTLSERTRAEILTKIAHLQLDQERLQVEVEEYEAEIEILNEGE